MVKSIKVINNSKVIENKISSISSAKVSIENTSSNKTYPYNVNGHKVIIYTTKVELSPFKKSSGIVNSVDIKDNKNRVFLVENISEVKQAIVDLKNSFHIQDIELDLKIIKEALKEIDKHNDTTYNSIKGIIKDFRENKQKIEDRISINKKKLEIEKSSLNIINQEIKTLKLDVQNKNRDIVKLKKNIGETKQKLKIIKSEQFYKKAIIRDKKSSDPKKDIKLLIDELIDEIDVSFDKTAIEIEEILNKKEYSKSVTKTKFQKRYIEARTIPYYVNGKHSKFGTVIILKVRFDGSSSTIIVEDKLYEKIYNYIDNLTKKYLNIDGWYGILILFLLPFLRFLFKSKDEEYYNNMGVVYYNKKEYDKAIKSYKKAIEINPNHELAKNNLKIVEDKIKN
ncbi:MAG: tetratricopeptide repeat protein [Campylobacterota bacterium]|nr:tetratricopeptide repeat protein [Campylobacterota bacterium]